MNARRVARYIGSRLAVLASTGGLFLFASDARASDGPPKNPVAELTRMLAGTFQGSSPGNDLTIVSTPGDGTPGLQVERLEVRVTGKYQGDAVLLRGLWRISYQGKAVSLVFIPGVDTIEAGRRFSDPTFSPTELHAGCWTILTAGNKGFEGTVRVFPNCRNAVQAGLVQSVGKEWIARFSADTIGFEDRETGETLSFSRAVGK